MNTFNLSCRSRVACLFPAGSMYSCVRVPCPPTKLIPMGPPTRELKRILWSMCFNLAFSSVISRKLWSHTNFNSHTLHCVLLYVAINTSVHGGIRIQVQESLQSCGITLQSQLLYLQGKTCFIISFLFFLVHSLNPLAATCSPPQTPVLKSQATSAL